VLVSHHLKFRIPRARSQYFCLIFTNTTQSNILKSVHIQIYSGSIYMPGEIQTTRKYWKQTVSKKHRSDSYNTQLRNLHILEQPHTTQWILFSNPPHLLSRYEHEHGHEQIIIRPFVQFLLHYQRQIQGTMYKKLLPGLNSLEQTLV
jgi:hypothetical protein